MQSGASFYQFLPKLQFVDKL